MSPGDMVRFALWGEFDYERPWEEAPKPHIGMLIEYDSLMKKATVLYRGELLDIRGQLIERAGKKDYGNR